MGARHDSETDQQNIIMHKVIHPGLFVFLEKDKKIVVHQLCKHKINVVYCVVIYRQNVCDLCSQSCSVFLHQMFTFSTKFNIKPNNNAFSWRISKHLEKPLSLWLLTWNILE